MVESMPQKGCATCEHKIKIHCNINFKLLQTPMGRDKFVKLGYNKKPEEIRRNVNSIAEMPYK